MKSNIKPIFLFADSQILFWKEKDKLFLNKIKKILDKEKNINTINASYIGTSNGDNPAFYNIFVSAMSQINISKCRLIPTKPFQEDYYFLEKSDLILLAGGNLEKGWNIIKSSFQEKIVDRYYKGAILIGVSVGAVQVGLKGWTINKNGYLNLFSTFQLIPYIIDVHNENNEWNRLKKAVQNGGEYCKGFGIPSGGGAIIYPDGSFEAIRHAVTEYFFDKKEIKYSLILP